MQCPSCYQENTEGSRFCNFCGADMGAAPAEQNGQQQYQTDYQDTYQQADYQDQQQTQGSGNGNGGEYQWDNFMKYLQAQPPPAEKPKSGVCSQCKSTELQFHDDGHGSCPECGREFWWDKARAPDQQSMDHQAQQTQHDGSNSYYSPEFEKQIMEKFLDENLPDDDDLAVLEQMKRLGVLYREQKLSWAEFKEKLDELKEEFKA